jgi:hypothetical protein
MLIKLIFFSKVYEFMTFNHYYFNSFVKLYFGSMFENSIIVWIFENEGKKVKWQCLLKAASVVKIHTECNTVRSDLKSQNHGHCV